MRSIEATWNSVTGCSKVSPGCAHCYAETFAERFRGVSGHHYEQGFDLRLWPQRLELPLRWRKPRLVFVNSMSDLFHPGIPESFVAQVWDAMARADWHTFQVLTKRPERMPGLLQRLGLQDPPLSNVWIGTSIENRRYVQRAEHLRRTPAAVRFISAEPLLGPLRCRRRRWPDGYTGPSLCLTGIDWLIAGGESGPRHRAIHADWVRDLRDACAHTGTAFFFKQWGGRTPKAGGRELDGRTWDQLPRPQAPRDVPPPSAPPASRDVSPARPRAAAADTSPRPATDSAPATRKAPDRTDAPPSDRRSQRPDGVCTGASAPNGRPQAHVRRSAALDQLSASDPSPHHGASGTRREVILRAIAERPGLTVSQLAHATALNESYLFRVLPGLLDEGRVVKRDRALFPTEPATAQRDACEAARAASPGARRRSRSDTSPDAVGLRSHTRHELDRAGARLRERFAQRVARPGAGEGKWRWSNKQAESCERAIRQLLAHAARPDPADLERHAARVLALAHAIRDEQPAASKTSSPAPAAASVGAELAAATRRTVEASGTRVGGRAHDGTSRTPAIEVLSDASPGPATVVQRPARPRAERATLILLDAGSTVDTSSEASQRGGT